MKPEEFFIYLGAVILGLIIFGLIMLGSPGRHYRKQPKRNYRIFD